MKLPATLAAVAALALVTGCGPNSSPRAAAPTNATATPPAATPEPSAAPEPSASAGPVSSAPLVLTPGGVGPYRIGVRLKPNLVANPVPASESCPKVIEYAATGQYAGALDLLVKDGVLVEIGTAAATARTAEGAAVGKPLADVTRIYGKRATAMRGEGGAPGVRISAGKNSIVFIGGPDQAHGIVYVRVGPTDLVTGRFTDSGPCV